MSTPTPGVAGWFEDPAGRNDHRWWDGSSWTDQVSSGGETSTDPLSGPVADPGSGAGEATQAFGGPPAPPTGAFGAPPSPPPSGGFGAPPPLPGSEPTQAFGAPATGGPGGYGPPPGPPQGGGYGPPPGGPTGPGAPLGPPPAGSSDSGGSNKVPLIIAAVLLVAAIVGGFFVFSGGDDDDGDREVSTNGGDGEDEEEDEETTTTEEEDDETTTTDDTDDTDETDDTDDTDDTVDPSDGPLGDETFTGSVTAGAEEVSGRELTVAAGAAAIIQVQPEEGFDASLSILGDQPTADLYTTFVQDVTSSTDGPEGSPGVQDAVSTFVTGFTGITASDALASDAPATDFSTLAPIQLFEEDPGSSGTREVFLLFAPTDINVQIAITGFGNQEGAYEVGVTFVDLGTTDAAEFVTAAGASPELEDILG